MRKRQLYGDDWPCVVQRHLACEDAMNLWISNMSWGCVRSLCLINTFPSEPRGLVASSTPEDPDAGGRGVGLGVDRTTS